MNSRTFFLLGLILLLGVGACSDPAAPRFPEPPEDEEDDPDPDDQVGFNVTFVGTGTLA
jgi:hypothetical protein